MQFENDFEVASPIDTVWNTLLDVEQVAPCMPGAEVLEQTGDNSYKVAIKIRLGPVAMQYRGDVEIVDPDPGSHQARMVARATEARGQGTANAEIGMKLEEQNGKTRAVLTTDLRLSGRAAAMGQGIVKDVAGKLTETFAECLATKLEGAPAANGDAAAETAASAATRPHQVAAAPEAEPAAAEAEPASAEPAAAEPAPGTPAEEPEEATAAEQSAAPPPPPPPAAPPQPEPAAAELNAIDLARSVATDKLREPRTLGVIAGVVVAALLIRRLRR
jgi:carbon monoxide dehydrogenase subunit G